MLTFTFAQGMAIFSFLETPRIKYLAYYLGLVIATLAIFHQITNFFTIDLHLPADNQGGDYMPLFFQVKSLISGDWIPFGGIHSARLGFPFHADWNDYPMNHSLFYSIIWLIGLFTKDWAVAFNVYWLCTFVLSSVTFAYVARRLRVHPAPAFILALLFAFLPFHFLRMGHLWLASYFMIPLQIFVALRIWDKRPLFFDKQSKSGNFWKRHGEKIHISVFLFLSSCAGIYYVMFFCVLCGFGIVSVFMERRSIRHAASGAMLIGIAFFGVLADSLPTLSKQFSQGLNASAVRREVLETEIYAFKPVQLLLPIAQHRVPQLAKISARYAAEMPLVNENAHSSLGILGSFGFVMLILKLLSPASRRRYLDNLAGLNLIALLLGLMGGIGVIIASIIPMFRGFNRISVFLGAISFLWLGWFFSDIRKKVSPFFFGIILFALLLLGVLDQTSPSYKYGQPFREQMTEEMFFFKQLERLVGADPVLQLPFVDFPALSYINKLSEYEQLNGYVFTDKVRWSYGNTFGRYPSAWLQHASLNPNSENMLEQLCGVGFRYIYVNRKGFSDNGQRIISQLTRFLKAPVLESKDKSLALFSLFAGNSKCTQSPDKRKELLSIPVYSFGRGLTYFDSEPMGYRAKITGGTGVISLHNPKEKPIRVKVSFEIENPEYMIAPLFLELGNLSEQIAPPNTKKRISRILTLSPGKSELMFRSERTLRSILDFRMDIVD